MKAGEFLFNYVSPVLAALIITLNTAAIITIARIKKKNALSSIYLLNLFISDLLTGIIIMFIKIIPLIRLPISLFLISIYTILRLSLFMSTFSLLVITYDRYIAVVKPFYYRQMKRHRAIINCILLWLSAIVILIAMYISERVVKKPGSGKYLDLVWPVLIFPTSVIISVGYVSIGRNLRQQKQRHKRDDGFTKLIIWIIVAYVVCWFPTSITTIWKLHGVESDEFYDSVFNSAFCIALLNSCVNPIIYLKHLRKNVYEVFRTVRLKVSRDEEKSERNAETTFTSLKTTSSNNTQ